MAVITYPLNGIDYNAENAETYLCTRTSGVYSADNNFAISITGNMQVTIGTGIAWINNEAFAGKSIASTSPISLDIDLADGALNRKDRVVIRFDKGLNSTSIVIKKGTPASSAAAPAIVRDGTVYELGIYVIDIPAGSVTVQAGNITNTMLDESVCGLMRDGVTGIPTATLQAEAEDIIEQINAALGAALSGGIPPHAVTHASGGSDELTPAAIGASPDDHVHGNITRDGKVGATAGYVLMTGTDGAVEAKSKASSGLEIAPAKVNRSGAINETIANNTVYTFADVSSLTLTGNTNEARGTITFGAAAPTISVTGFSASAGDDITGAQASEIWEFSTYLGRIIWKNWSAT